MTPEQLAKFHSNLLLAILPEDSMTLATNNVLAKIYSQKLIKDLDSESLLIVYERLTTIAAEIQAILPREEIRRKIIIRDRKLIADSKAIREAPKPVRGLIPGWKKILTKHPTWSREEAMLYTRIAKTHSSFAEKDIIKMIEGMRGKK